MCSSWVREIPMVEMGITSSGPVTWFWRRRTPDVQGWVGNEPAEQYTLSYMLEVIRAAAGPRWQPAGLKLECSRSGWGAVSPALAGVRKHYRAPLLAVALPTQLLALPISIQPLTDDGPTGEPAGDNFHGSLRQVLRAYRVGGVPEQHCVAETLRMSARSLRRRLEEEGTSWRAVVNDVKFAWADEQLKRHVAVHEVAKRLGYADPAHFTRFFKHRTGVAPSRWRGHVERARELADRSRS
jgi:AraC-like DNA-binding protein